MVTKVSLRQKKISKGRKSLYLDFYPAIPHPETGEPTRREFLGLYLFEKPKTSMDNYNLKFLIPDATSRKAVVSTAAVSADTVLAVVQTTTP